MMQDSVHDVRKSRLPFLGTAGIFGTYKEYVRQLILQPVRCPGSGVACTGS